MNETLEMNFLRVRTERDEYKELLDKFAIGAAALHGALDMRNEKWIPDLLTKRQIQYGIDELEACLKKWREMFNDEG